LLRPTMRQVEQAVSGTHYERRETDGVNSGAHGSSAADARHLRGPRTGVICSTSGPDRMRQLDGRAGWAEARLRRGTDRRCRVERGAVGAPQVARLTSPPLRGRSGPIRSAFARRPRLPLSHGARQGAAGRPRSWNGRTRRRSKRHLDVLLSRRRGGAEEGAEREASWVASPRGTCPPTTPPPPKARGSRGAGEAARRVRWRLGVRGWGRPLSTSDHQTRGTPTWSGTRVFDRAAVGTRGGRRRLGLGEWFRGVHEGRRGAVPNRDGPITGNTPTTCLGARRQPPPPTGPLDETQDGLILTKHRRLAAGGGHPARRSRTNRARGSMGGSLRPAQDDGGAR